jgi:hypothetical protein
MREYALDFLSNITVHATIAIRQLAEHATIAIRQLAEHATTSTKVSKRQAKPKYSVYQPKSSIKDEGADNHRIRRSG